MAAQSAHNVCKVAVMSKKDAIGTIYLLHFSEKLHHAQHYLGWTENLDQRIDTHRAGNGSRLAAAIKDKGISFTVVRTWQGTKTDERRLKKRKNHPKLCPTCKA
jgi:predicted GIY-YIG superfamily endonuclease